MPLDPSNDDAFAAAGILTPDKQTLYDRAVSFLKPARALFGLSQNVGGQVARSVLGEDAYTKALEERQKADLINPDSGTMDLAEALPGAGDVINAAIDSKNPFYRAIGEPVVRLAGNIAGDPSNLLGAGLVSKGGKALASGVGHVGGVAFAPDIIQGGVEGLRQIKAGYESGDVAGAIGGGVQTVLSAGLGTLVAKGMIDPFRAKVTELQFKADNGDLNAKTQLAEIRQQEHWKKYEEQLNNPSRIMPDESPFPETQTPYQRDLAGEADLDKSGYEQQAEQALVDQQNTQGFKRGQPVILPEVQESVPTQSETPEELGQTFQANREAARQALTPIEAAYNDLPNKRFGFKQLANLAPEEVPVEPAEPPTIETPQSIVPEAKTEPQVEPKSIEQRQQEILQNTPPTTLEDIGKLAPPSEEPPAKPATPMAPSVEEHIRVIESDQGKQELYQKFATLQNKVVGSAEKMPGIDKTTLDKVVGDAYIESVSTFTPSDKALEAYSKGNKKPLETEFKKFAEGNMRQRVKDAYNKKGSNVSAEDNPNVINKPAVDTAPEAPDELPAVSQSLAEKIKPVQNKKLDAMRASIAKAIEGKTTVADRINAAQEAIVKEHPDFMETELLNPGKDGAKAGDAFKAKAWQYWIAREAEPGLAQKEIAKILGVNETQISKYKKALGDAFKTPEAIDKAVKEVQGTDLTGKLLGTEGPGKVQLEYPEGKTTIVRKENGDIGFEGTPTEGGLRDAIVMAFQKPDSFTGKIDLSGLDPKLVDIYEKAGFVKKIGDAFEIQLPQIKHLQGGLGFIPTTKILESIKGLGEKGIDAAIHGAMLLRRGLTNAVEWSKNMLSKFGDSVKSGLRSLYNSLSEAFRSFSVGELKDEPQGTVVGSLGGVFQDFFGKKASKESVERMTRDVGDRATQAIADVEARKPVKPGSPSGEIKGKDIGVPRQEAENVAYNSLRDALPKEADAVAVRVMQYLNPILKRATKASERKWIAEAATNLGLVDPHTFVSKMEKGVNITPAEAIAMREIAKEAFVKVVDSAAELKSAIAIGGDERIAKANKNWIEALQTSMVGGAVAGDLRNDAGRLLRSFRTVLELSPEELKSSKFVNALKELPWLNKEKAEYLYNLWNKGEFDQFARGIKPPDPSLANMALEAWKGSLLTWTSHLANTGSNFSYGIIRGRERGLAAGLDRMRVALFGGEREIYKAPGNLGWAAMQDALAGAWPKFREDMIDAFKLNPAKVRGPEDLRRAISSLGDSKVAELLKFNFKLLDSADFVAKEVSRLRNTAVFAWTEAMNAAKGVESKAKELYPQYYEEMKSYMDNPTMKPTHWSEARIKSRAERISQLLKRDTFQEDLKGAMRSVSRGIHDSTLLSIIAPFVRTPVNIALETAQHTPLGLLRIGRKIHDARLEGIKQQLKKLKPGETLNSTWVEQIKNAVKDVGYEQIEDELAKTIAGTVGGYIVMNALGNYMTGGGPNDPKKAEQLKQTGWQPYSFKVGDQYLSYQRFEPISAVLGMAADINEGLRYGEFDKAADGAKRLGATLTENMTNKTFMSGLEGMFTAWSDPSRYFGRWVKQLEGSAVPNTIGYIPFGTLARAIDPVYRDTEAFTASPMIAKMPFLSETLPAQIGPTGEEREREGTAIERLISPVKRTQAKKGPEATVAAEADRIGYVMNAPKKFQDYGVKKVPYTKEEMDLFIKQQQAAIDHMANVVKDPSYQALPDNEEDPRWNYGRKTKQDVMRDVFQRYRRLAMGSIKPAALARGRNMFKEAQNGV